MRSFEFYYDFVCPYAFLASREVGRIGARNGGVRLCPILLGGVFRAIGAVDDPNANKPPAKRAYGGRDLSRAAAAAGVELQPPTGHPRRTVTALRAAIASDDLARATEALFAAYWLGGRDLADDAVLAEVLSSAGFDGLELVERAKSEGLKEELRRRTDEAVAHGVFGVPTFRVVPSGQAPSHEEARGDLVFGVDRLRELQAKLRAGRSLPFYFDYASPFAYLGAMTVRALAARTGATIDYRPILLGGLFKSIGTPNVPLLEMPVPKQRYLNEELYNAAERLGLPFKFTSRFPMNTVKALRLTLAAPQQLRGPLSEAIFRAMWAEDRDISNASVLLELAKSVGAEEAFSAIESPAIKAALFASTTDAEKLGVFGVPSFFVGDELYWGQDRMSEVEAALLYGDVSSLAP